MADLYVSDCVPSVAGPGSDAAGPMSVDCVTASAAEAAEARYVAGGSGDAGILRKNGVHRSTDALWISLNGATAFIEATPSVLLAEGVVVSAVGDTPKAALSC
jgi:hypothetical protein